MKYEEVLLTAEYVRFFCSDPPNYTHNHFDISVPSDPFSTRVSSEQRELYHTCLQTSLGEGGDSRGRKFLKNTVLETLVWPCAEGLDCSANWLRAHHSLYITHPACRQRKKQRTWLCVGAFNWNGHFSWGKWIPTGSAGPTACPEWNVQSVETAMPANTSVSRQGCGWFLWQRPRWAFPWESTKATCNMGLQSRVGNLREILKAWK